MLYQFYNLTIFTSNYNDNYDFDVKYYVICDKGNLPCIQYIGMGWPGQVT